MKVLVADDDPGSRAQLEATLVKWGYEVVSARDGGTAFEALEQDNGPRLALLDWPMPGLETADLTRRLRARADRPYVYVILLTSRANKNGVLEALEAGADDFATKPLDLTELRARMGTGRRLLTLLAELAAAHERMRILAMFDSLTGLWNQRMVLDVLDREIARAERKQSPLGVLMADLDRFKQTNDTHGHLAGDAVLREAARAMQAGVRPYDGIGRYGGEEFLVVLPGCNAVCTMKVGERLRAAVGGLQVELSGTVLRPTVSVGAAAVVAPQSLDADTLLRAADKALYLAKQNGRNRVELAESV